MEVRTIRMIQGHASALVIDNPHVLRVLTESVTRNYLKGYYHDAAELSGSR